MSKFQKSFSFFFLILLFISYVIFAQSLTNNPIKLSEYVTDETGTLSSEELRSLRLKLKNFDDSTSTQIVVLMLNSLNGEPIENVANSIFKYNKIGVKGKNNGVLLLISKGDRKIRIEVGYGLEGALPDAIAKRIIQNDIAPELKRNNYYKGIDNGITSIIRVTKGEYNKEEKEKEKEGTSNIFLYIIVGLVAVFFGFIIFSSIIRSKNSYTGSESYSSSSNYDSYSSETRYSDYSSSSSDDSSSFSGGGGDSGGGGASGNY